jgi:hypothetical protein
LGKIESLDRKTLACEAIPQESELSVLAAAVKAFKND